MYKRGIFLFFLFFCCLENGWAQPAGKILRILERIQQTYVKMKTLTARQTIILGSPQPETDLIVGHLEGSVCLKKQAADSLLGWNFVNTFCMEERGEGYQVYYLGDSLVYFTLENVLMEKDPATKSDTEWGFGTFQKWQQKVCLYYDRLCLPDSVFQQRYPEDAWLVGAISLAADTVIDGRHCYVLENRQTGTVPKLQVDTRNYERLAVDKQSYLPVCLFTHFVRNVKGKPHIDQKNQTQLHEWRLNEPVPDFVFSIPEIIRSEAVPAVEELQEGDRMPDGNLINMQGDTLALYDFEAERMVLEFCYIGCGACALAFDEIQEHVLDVCEQKKYLFLCINPLDSYGLMKKYVQEMSVACPYLKGESQWVKQCGITGFPRFFVLDRNFRIRKVISGYWEGMGKYLREFLLED